MLIKTRYFQYLQYDLTHQFFPAKKKMQTMSNSNSKIKLITLCPQLKFETQIYSHLVPNTCFYAVQKVSKSFAMAERNVFVRSNTWTVSSNPTPGMDVPVRLLCVSVVLCR
jgi:hypothetical protein